MNAAEVIEELKRFSPEERQHVFEWLKTHSTIDWRRIDELMKGAPKLTEDEILNLPRVRPARF